MTNRERIEGKQSNTTPVKLHAASIDEVVHLRRWTGQEAKQYFVWCKEKSAGEITQKLVQLTLANEDGTLLYKPDELGQVGKLDNAFIEEIADEASRLNLLRMSDLRELRENFSRTRASAGSISLPAISGSSNPSDSSAS